MQPPSGGCVLKLQVPTNHRYIGEAAAFGRLCVETELMSGLLTQIKGQPPSGGCVLKPVKGIPRALRHLQPPSGGCVLKLAEVSHKMPVVLQPPSGGCVLKLQAVYRCYKRTGSRLRAAVC